MSNEKSIEEIKAEIDRVTEMLKVDHSTFGKGKLSGLYFALGKKLNYDGKMME